ncbi:GNAT family N-acetyltransferase [Amycolatopsis rubida]|uniref:GNAT family N-acetyltransferase n=1 Tax=Amycolatopsis rubida TaxID=112413 RepID=A0A1I5IYF2_9PSEU|nr:MULTISPECIES: GNAT family N-acetyltransferase [Amycolatopsis]MYW91284.1 GNAT family N-acetyltransferase [Amycolatopsis rubida]NEC56269.1 GNAT family N-acetyltransferase [Amycolatopsis rubida]OAP28859.1 Acetyltransferase (GNAT) family protein [Amycolatopsis sp. M39]SFO65196.1 Predicted acetyltransferase [Amycolatopsis rubida]
MPELLAPTAGLYRSWLEAHREWGPGLHEDGFGLSASDQVDSPAGFAAWVGSLARDRAVYRWLVEDGQVLGGIALRTGPAEYVRWAGHLGFGIRPSARGRGLASWALRQMLTEARRMDLARVLLVCAEENLASATTIERAGGVLEEVRQTGRGPVRRYWVTVGAASSGAPSS